MQELTFTVVICNIRAMQSRSIGLPNPIMSASLMPKEKKKEKEKVKERYWNCLNNWRGSLFFVFFFFFFVFFFFFWGGVLLNCRHVFSAVAVSLFEYVDKDFVLEWKFLSRGCRDKTMNVCYEGFDNKVYIPNLTNFHLVEVFWRGRQQKQRNLYCFVFHAFFFVYLRVSLFFRQRSVLQARGANLAPVKVFCS